MLVMMMKERKQVRNMWRPSAMSFFVLNKEGSNPNEDMDMEVEEIMNAVEEAISFGWH